jgi:hypothetical protein
MRSIVILVIPAKAGIQGGKAATAAPGPPLSRGRRQRAKLKVVDFFQVKA